MLESPGLSRRASSFEPFVVFFAFAPRIPEFNYTKLTAMTELKDANGGASTWAAKPLLRDITLWDLLGMTGGFGYSWIKNGGLAKTVRKRNNRPQPRLPLLPPPLLRLLY